MCFSLVASVVLFCIVCSENGLARQAGTVRREVYLMGTWVVLAGEAAAPETGLADLEGMVRVIERAEEDLSKLQRAIVDLASVGFSVRRILDTIPEPDPVIHLELTSLIEQGVVAVQG